MSVGVMRAELDCTMDEIVDVNMRLVAHTETYRRQRRQCQWIFAVCFAGVLTVEVLSADDVPSFAALGIAALLAPATGLAVGILYGRYHDWYVRRKYSRLVNEMYGGAHVVHCEFELRNDGLWSKSIHAEVSMPWSRLTRVADVPGSCLSQ
jgi:hypothetical protein